MEFVHWSNNYFFTSSENWRINDRYDLDTILSCFIFFSVYMHENMTKHTSFSKSMKKKSCNEMICISLIRTEKGSDESYQRSTRKSYKADCILCHISVNLVPFNFWFHCPRISAITINDWLKKIIIGNSGFFMYSK